MTNGDKIRSMTDEELREKVWRNMENCEEMAKLTLDTPREQYWRGCMDALKKVLGWMDEESNENQVWKKICDLQPVDFGPPDTEPRENCIPGKQNPLTLGQLKKMDGQPVWVEEVNHWALIDIEKGGPYNGIPFAVWAENGVKFTYNIRARKLHCYRYQQKEAQE